MLALRSRPRRFLRPGLAVGQPFVQLLARPPGSPGVQAFVHRDPVDRAEEPPARVVAVQPFVRLDERVLRCIKGVLVVPQHAVGDREQHPLIPPDEGLEG